MSQPITFEDRLVDFLHETFPDSWEMPAGELKAAVERLLAKAAHYGFSYESEIAIYVTTAYLLGENFDTEFPAASQILTHPQSSAEQKAETLQNWTQELFQVLEGGQENHPESDSTSSEQLQGAEISDYLDMETQSQAYGDMADWLVQQLIEGNAAAVIGNFSPNFAAHLGMPTVIRVFEEQMLPFFAGSQGVSPSRTVTFTHDQFGSQGFAFYCTLLGLGEEKPFALYLVNENGRLVLANLVLHKTYAELH